MGYYLHAHFWTQIDDLTWVDTVGCCDIEDWQVEKERLPVPSQRLVVRSLCRLGASARTGWRRFGEARPSHLSFPLDDPRDRFYIVENDPRECQRPNGPIIWRWENGVATDYRRAA